MLKKKKTNVRLGKNKGEKNIVATSNQGGVTDAELKEFIQRDSTLSGQDISSLYRSLATIIEENINLGNVVICYRSVFVNPFGWTPVGYRYAHNLWLDIARVAGLLAFIPFLSATILHVKTLLHLLQLKTKTNFVIIIISINAAMLLSSFVEPVIEGSLLFFCLLMMIWGITKTISMNNIKNEGNLIGK